MATKRVKRTSYSNPISAAQLRELIGYFKYWKEFFGLTNWRIEHVPNKRTTGNALIELFSWDETAYLVCYAVKEDWGSYDITSNLLKRLALHEVLHVLLYKALTFVHSRGPDAVETHGAEHEVVHRLMDILCPEEI